MHRTFRYAHYAWVCMVLGASRGQAEEPSAPQPFETQVATSAWVTMESPVYCDPNDDWAKDPSVVKAGDTY